MGTDHKGQRYCDNCGELFDKAARVHHEAEYCRNCYGQNFVRAACSRCSGSMRTHRLALSGGMCSSCERAERTCLRCARPTPYAAKLVDGKAVCANCVGHFNEEQTCSLCGRVSRRMFSSLLLKEGELAVAGDETDAECAVPSGPICQPCRNKATHATCSLCSRHRRIARVDAGGKPLCAGCAVPEPATHTCPSCGTVVAGGGTARCRNCVDLASARDRARVLRAGLEQAWCRSLWDGFVKRLTTPPSPPGKAPARVNASLEYFELIDAAFGGRDQLSSTTLHQAISSLIHRRHLLAYRFLLGELGTEGAAEARQQSSEARRLLDVLARAKGRPYEMLLKAYVDALRAGGAADRTVRMYAGVAQTFCDRAAVTPKKPWSSTALVEFLKHTPGAANSLSRFVTHCRKALGWDVAMPSKARRSTAKTSMARSVDRVRRALAAVQGRPVDELKLLEVVRVISTATGLAMNKLASARVPVPTTESATIVVSEDAHIEAGHLLYPNAVRWHQLIAARGS